MRRMVGSPQFLGLSLAAFAALGVLSSAGSARAQDKGDEPRSATEPRVMEEPGEVVDVLDAFDGKDPFDAHVSLAFSYSTKTARILRETAIYGAGLTTGGFTANTMNVAEFSETTSRLTPRIDFGLYHDVGLYIELPIVLSNSRKLEDLDGSSNQLATVAAGAPGEVLFTLPFESPDRSGLEYFAVGLEADLLNQARDRTKPTWLFGVEGRFSVGEPMHACNPNPKSGQVACANPADINRNGDVDGSFEGVEAGDRDPGISRGTVGLAARTLMSKRLKYIEPYGGFHMLAEFQQDSSDYGVTDLEGSLVNHPPIRGGMTAGIMIIPWEDREKFGRLTFDLRIDGDYVSEGRDYSEIFDAVGSSDAPSLRNPQWARFKSNPDQQSDGTCAGVGGARVDCPASIIDEGSQKTYTTGLTDVAAHGAYRASASVLWQASEYVKFQFGLGFTHEQGHLITADQPCNPDLKKERGEAGPCSTADGSVTGLPNPNYRASINAVGRRFLVDDGNTFDLFLKGVLMF
jgi:hypothetical protein